MKALWLCSRRLLLTTFLLISGVFVELLFATGSSSTEAEAFIDQAKKLLIQGQHNDAIQALEQAVQVDPTDYLVRFKRAALFLSIGRNSNAMEDLNRILQQKPDFDQALFQRAKLQLRECSLQQAKKDLETLLDRLSDSTEVRQLLSEAQQTETLLSELQNAVSYGQTDDELMLKFQQAIEVCPQDYEIRLLRAKYYESRGDYELSANDYSRAAILRTNDISSLLKATELFLKVGQVDNALNSVKTCLHFDPEHKQCSKKFKLIKKLNKSLEKSQSLIDHGRLIDALGEDAIGVGGGDSKNSAWKLVQELKIEKGIKGKVLMMACDIFAKLKRNKETIEWCTRALELESNDINGLCNRADAYIAQEDYDSAMRDFSTAKENGGGNVHRVLEGMQKVQRLQRMASRKDYYKILGVPRDASDREIKKAYRKKAIEYHPDKYQGEQAEGEKKMAEINQAYEVLSNPELRQRFDNGEDPNDPTGGHEHHRGGHPFGGGMPVFFQSGNPFGGAGGFEFRFQ